MDAKSPPENPLSLWHGLDANWRSRVARHLCETADAAIKNAASLQQDLAAARSLTDIAAAHSAATGRIVQTLADNAGSLTEIGAATRTELAETVRRTVGAATPID